MDDSEYNIVKRVSNINIIQKSKPIKNVHKKPATLA